MSPTGSRPSPDAVRAALHAELRACTILLVDDEEANLDLLEALLGGEGYERLVRTGDARQVLALVQRHGPDLVLLDLHMPHRSGLEVLHDLRGERAWRRLPARAGAHGRRDGTGARRGAVARCARLRHQAVRRGGGAAAGGEPAGDATAAPAAAGGAAAPPRRRRNARHCSPSGAACLRRRSTRRRRSRDCRNWQCRAPPTPARCCWRNPMAHPWPARRPACPIPPRRAGARCSRSPSERRSTRSPK